MSAPQLSLGLLKKYTQRPILIDADGSRLVSLWSHLQLSALYLEESIQLSLPTYKGISIKKFDDDLKQVVLEFIDDSQVITNLNISCPPPSSSNKNALIYTIKVSAMHAAYVKPIEIELSKLSGVMCSQQSINDGDADPNSSQIPYNLLNEIARFFASEMHAVLLLSADKGNQAGSQGLDAYRPDDGVTESIKSGGMGMEAAAGRVGTTSSLSLAHRVPFAASSGGRFSPLGSLVCFGGATLSMSSKPSYSQHSFQGINVGHLTFADYLQMVDERGNNGAVAYNSDILATCDAVEEKSSHLQPRLGKTEVLQLFRGSKKSDRQIEMSEDDDIDGDEYAEEVEVVTGTSSTSSARPCAASYEAAYQAKDSEDRRRLLVYDFVCDNALQRLAREYTLGVLPHAKTDNTIAISDWRSRARFCRENANVAASVAHSFDMRRFSYGGSETTSYIDTLLHLECSDIRSIQQMWSVLAVCLETFALSRERHDHKQQSQPLDADADTLKGGRLSLWSDSSIGLPLLTRILRYIFTPKLGAFDVQNIATVVSCVGGVKRLGEMMGVADTVDHDIKNMLHEAKLISLLLEYSRLLRSWSLPLQALMVENHCISHEENRTYREELDIYSPIVSVALTCFFCGDHCAASAGKEDEEVACLNPLATRRQACSRCSPISREPPSSDVGLECAICLRVARGATVFCAICRHGGHLDCLNIWFGDWLNCPTGCGCACGSSLLF